MGEWDDAMAAMEVAVDYLPDPDAWPELWERVYGMKAFIAGHRDDVATVAADLARPKVADSRARKHGGRGQRGPRNRPATGWDALTGAELKVAVLVANGLSNPDIATRLFLSRRTVQTHVSHVLAKLGARSRVEIARLSGERSG